MGTTKMLTWAGAILALVLPGVAAAAEMPELLGDAQPRQGGSVVYAIESDIPSFDPHITFGGIVPALAESWEVLHDAERLPVSKGPDGIASRQRTGSLSTTYATRERRHP